MDRFIYCEIKFRIEECTMRHGRYDDFIYQIVPVDMDYWERSTDVDLGHSTPYTRRRQVQLP